MMDHLIFEKIGRSESDEKIVVLNIWVWRTS